MLYAPLQSMAWGNEGHQICGQIAWSYLNPRARVAVNAILGGEHVAMASTWADDIKKDPKYKYTAPWHYIDLNRTYTYPQLVDYLSHDTQMDLYTRVNFFIKQLSNKNLAQNTKLFDLKMLIHLVEDAHQPMHTAHVSDRGGNDFIVSWFNEPTNLHAVWDNKLIEHQQMKYTKYAWFINHTTDAQRTAWQRDPVSKWLFESNRISERLYTDIHPGDNLGEAYYHAHIAIVNQQLLKAGVRLAGVLNQLFG